jgi:UPF0716 protein FxsA
LARLFALGFLLLPLVEIALFIVVGRAIGLFPTLALVILAAIGGALLLRQQGLGVVERLRSNVSAGTLPARSVFDTLVFGFAGLLLIVPGFLSDIAALVLLLPSVRNWLFTSLSARVTVVRGTSASYRSYDYPVDPDAGAPKSIDLNDKDWRDEDR